MSESKLVATFQVQQRDFSIYLHEYEFTLQLKPIFQKSKTQPKRNAWLSFADEPTYEDVNEGINAFEVMRLTRLHLLRYIAKYTPSYFYFHASTARKAKIYPRVAAHLAQDLPMYRYCQDNGSFYFYHQA